jgi:hypothetical protein
MDRWPGRELAVAALTLAAGTVGCNRAPRDAAPAPVPKASSSSRSPATTLAATSSVPHPDASGHTDEDCRPSGPPPPPPSGASATALRADHLPRLSGVRVFAHSDAVILRKRDSNWVTAGDDGCTVPASRMARALDNLSRLRATKTDEKPADGSAFELQIVALMGEDVAVQLEIAQRNDQGDLVQIFDGSTFRLRGLDRSLWSPRPADWCKEL